MQRQVGALKDSLGSTSNLVILQDSGINEVLAMRDATVVKLVDHVLHPLSPWFGLLYASISQKSVLNLLRFGKGAFVNGCKDEEVANLVLIMGTLKSWAAGSNSRMI